MIEALPSSVPRNAGGFDVTPTLLRSPMAFLAEYLAVAPSVARPTGLQAKKKTLRLVEAARDAQEKLKHMGLSMKERPVPRVGLSESRTGSRPRASEEFCCTSHPEGKNENAL